MGGVSQSLLGLGVDEVKSRQSGRVLRHKGPGLAKCRGGVLGEGQLAPSPPARGSGERCSNLP